MAKQYKGKHMKKTITTGIILVSSIFTLLNANEVNDLQQKTNYILIKKVNTLKSKIEAYKLIQERNELDIQKIKARLNMGDNKLLYVEKQEAISNTKSISKRDKKDSFEIASKVIKNNGLTDNKNKSAYDFKNLYQMQQECQGYTKSSGQMQSRKIFKRGAYVLLVEKQNNRSKTHTGVWVNNSCFKKINNQDIKQGQFYKIGTYMANTRSKPGIEHNIESVFMKNDIILVVGKERSKENGIWLDIKNDGFINQRIVKPIGN